MTVSRFCLMLSLAFLSASPAFAENAKVVETITDSTKGAPMGDVIEINRLNPERIKNFYNASKQIHLKPYNEYLAFMSRYTAPDVQFTLNLTNHMPSPAGQAPQKQTLIMNKKQFVDSLPESYQVSQGASITHKIENIQISEDGQSATAKDVTVISNRMQIPNSQEFLQVESQSTCEDSFQSMTGGQPQMTLSTCDVTTYFFKK